MDKDTLISTSSLFHYTKPEYLKDIITNGFKPRISKETFDIEKSLTAIAWREAAGYPAAKDSSFTLGIPMICFCDIPLPLVKDHIAIYNKYAIAMNKSWAIKTTGVSPVIYVNHGSEFLSNYRELYRLSNDPVFERIRINILSILRLIKPYMGYFKKGDYENNDHKFYDEREWRYVPPFLLTKPYYLPEEEDQISKFHDEANSIQFEADDIDYIVVNDKKDIPVFQDVLAEKYGTFDVNKIITLEN